MALRSMLLVALALLASACSQAADPVQHAQGFWNALGAGRLDEARGFVLAGDGERQARLLEALQGKRAAVERLAVPAAAEAAFLPTRFETPGAGADAPVLEAVTVLRRTDAGWRVDLDETARAFRSAGADAAGRRLAEALGRLEDGLGRSAGEFGDALGELGRDLGEILAREGTARADELESDLERSAEELEAELGRSLEALGAALARGVEELEAALAEAEARRREQEEEAP